MKWNQLIEDYTKALLKKYYGAEANKLDSELLKFLDEQTYFKIKAWFYLTKGEHPSILENVLNVYEK